MIKYKIYPNQPFYNGETMALGYADVIQLAELIEQIKNQCSNLPKH